MSCEYQDGFDHYSAAQVGRWWPNFLNDGGRVLVDAANGRNGTPGLRLITSAGSRGYVRRPFVNNTTTVIIGAAVRLSAGATQSGGILFALLDVATLQVEIRPLADGAIRATRNGTTLGTSAPGLLNTSTHRMVEVKFTVDDSAGVVVVKVDNVTVLNLTAQDTKNTANAYATQYQIGDHNAGAECDIQIDDFRILTTAGSVNNDFIGDRRSLWCPALAEGDQNDYTPSTGTNNAALVDDNPANDDTDYVESSTVGNIDFYTVTVSPAIPTGSTIAAMQVCSTDRKTDGGTRTARHKIRFGSGPTTSNGADYAPGATYNGDYTTFEDAITPAEVNAPMQIGIEVRS